MAKKIRIKVDKFRVSKVSEKADLLMWATEQAIKTSEKFSKASRDFEDALMDAIYKHLKGVPVEELKALYEDQTLVDFVVRQLKNLDYIENKLGIPWDTPKRLPDLYV